MRTGGGCGMLPLCPEHCGGQYSSMIPSTVLGAGGVVPIVQI
jgi:hypothetical protein